MRFKKCSVLVVGESKVVPGILICLLEAGHEVYFLDDKDTGIVRLLNTRLSSEGTENSNQPIKNLQLLTTLEKISPIDLVVAITAENLKLKKEIINNLEKAIPDDTLIAINSESIPLGDLQEAAELPERILALNWAEPANTTFFLEVVSNKANSEETIDDLVKVARKEWRKDPYVLKNGLGIRSRMLAALVREAFGLIENKYVKVEDIDRACRNDAGYYLPFSGHFRYMDLMGAYLYGIVMKELNPELSKATEVPAFFSEMIQKGCRGMENNKGFYAYTEEEKQQFESSFQYLNHEMKSLISHYSHDFLEKAAFEK